MTLNPPPLKKIPNAHKYVVLHQTKLGVGQVWVAEYVANIFEDPQSVFLSLRANFGQICEKFQRFSLANEIFGKNLRRL